MFFDGHMWPEPGLGGSVRDSHIQTHPNPDEISRFSNSWYFRILLMPHAGKRLALLRHSIHRLATRRRRHPSARRVWAGWAWWAALRDRDRSGFGGRAPRGRSFRRPAPGLRVSGVAVEATGAGVQLQSQLASGPEILVGQGPFEPTQRCNP